jgi:hypothetical protein
MHPIAKGVDLIVFLILLFPMDWNFIPAFLVSILAGVVTDQALKRMGG